MNLLDILLLLGIASGVGIGLFQGMLHQLITLVVLYLAAVMATAYHGMFANWLRSVTGAGLQSTQSLAFVLILVVAFGLLMFATRDYRKARLPLLKHFDQLGGMALGFVVACVVISILIAITSYAVDQPTSWNQPGKPVLASFPGGSVRLAFLGALRDSVLADLFARLLPYIAFTIRPWTSVDILQVL